MAIVIPKIRTCNLARAGLQTLKACFRHASLTPTERVPGATHPPPPPRPSWPSWSRRLWLARSWPQGPSSPPIRNSAPAGVFNNRAPWPLPVLAGPWTDCLFSSRMTWVGMGEWAGAPVFSFRSSGSNHDPELFQSIYFFAFHSWGRASDGPCLYWVSRPLCSSWSLGWCQPLQFQFLLSDQPSQRLRARNLFPPLSSEFVITARCLQPAPSLPHRGSSGPSLNPAPLSM